MKFYAGIGARKTPPEILSLMTQIAQKLDSLGWTLRSGGAIGADNAFLQGSDNAQIWLPYWNFNLDLRKAGNNIVYKTIDKSDLEATLSADKFHPEPSRLSPVARKMMERNFRQIVGLGESNSKFVICFTENGEASGGTGQAIRIANRFEIPVFNLQNEKDRERLEKFIRSTTQKP